MNFNDMINPYNIDIKNIKKISKHKDISVYKFKPEYKTDVGTLVRFASKITSTARISLWWRMKQLNKILPNYQFYACDTDSIMCSSSLKPDLVELKLLELGIANDPNSN